MFPVLSSNEFLIKELIFPFVWMLINSTYIFFFIFIYIIIVNKKKQIVEYQLMEYNNFLDQNY